jgi:hypothetical protein
MSLDDLEGLTWLRAQPEGRVAVNAAKLGRQWGWNRTRTSRRLKAWEQAGPIRRNAEAITVPGSVTPTVTEDTAAVTEAADVTRTSGAERAPFHDTGQPRCFLALACVSAAFSIEGLTAILAGAFWPSSSWAQCWMPESRLRQAG